MALYRNCRELLYDSFNEIKLTGDLTYLIKDNEKHDEKELIERWEEILDEYFTISENFEQKKYFRDRAEMKALELKLSVLYHIRYLEGLPLTEEHKKALEPIKKRYRVHDLERDILGVKDDISIKLSRMKSKVNEDGGATYEEILSAMRVNGISVSRKELTVSEYVSLLKEIQKKNSKKEK